MDERPIGYWLKTLDRLIDTRFERVLADRGLTRRHWQALNVLGTGADLRDELRPFWGAGEITPHDVLDDLKTRGWAIETPEGRYRLTEAGSVGRTAIGAHVAELRDRVTDGITTDDYLTTVRSLRRMAENLESA